MNQPQFWRKELIELVKIYIDIKIKCASTWKERNETFQDLAGVHLNFGGITSKRSFCLSRWMWARCKRPVLGKILLWVAHPALKLCQLKSTNL